MNSFGRRFVDATQLAALGLAIAVTAWLVVAPYVAIQRVMDFARTDAENQVWSAQPIDGGVLVEMPATLGLRDPTVDSTYMYYQTWHDHPLVNGYSSFRPPTYDEIVAKLDGQYNGFQGEQLGILQSLGVRYILFHAANYKERAWRKIEQDVRQFHQVHEIGAFPSGTFGDDHLFWIEPLPPGAGLRLYMGPSPTNPSALVVGSTQHGLLVAFGHFVRQIGYSTNWPSSPSHRKPSSILQPPNSPPSSWVCWRASSI